MTVHPLWFSSREEWQRWLVIHHATETEAHLLISRKATRGGVHYEEALDEALCFGWIDGKLHSHDEASFLLRFSPRRPDSIWSESNRARAVRLIREGRMEPAGLVTIQVAKASGAWAHALRPSRKPRMPADLGRALREVQEAWKHFRAWGNSFQASSIHWVTDAKKEATRERRIRRVVERAAQDSRPGIEGP